MPLKVLTERRYQAHRLHQFRVEARLSVIEAAKNAGIAPEHWWRIEYANAGTVKEIKRLIALFVPGQRRMINVGTGEEVFARIARNNGLTS